MLRLLADENFDNDLLRGLQLKDPAVDILRVQDVGLREAKDPQILEWAAQNRRIVISSDRRTLPRHAFQRVESGKGMPGVFSSGGAHRSAR